MMAEEKLKSYIADIQLEIVSDDDNTVKAIRIHGFHHEQIPVFLWCDLLRRFGQMTPNEEVLFVQSGKRINGMPIKHPTGCIPGRLYVLTEKFGDYIPGDYFFGLDGGSQLQHVRTGGQVAYDISTEDIFYDTGQKYDPEAFARYDAMLEHQYELLKKDHPEIQKRV